ncbi:MAG: hypothetical protein COT43_09115 [Candidatus Marinimicrobia bacterium CG08_land_8_20_14_0_20_45_22]|nr:MAG: hypothetical protein COT43_09115 [Candidatus Marinimicrobia bacterium CG08_land_8_20_14_0_20_45_22]
MRKIRAQELLFQSFDRDLELREKRLLEAALKEHPELIEERKSLESIYRRAPIRKSISFSPWFVDRTMNRIRVLSNQKESINLFLSGFLTAFRRVAVIASAMVVLILAFNVSTSTQTNLSSAIGIHEISMDEMIDPINYFTME